MPEFSEPILSSKVVLTSYPKPKGKIRISSFFEAFRFEMIFSTFVSPTVGRPSVIKTSIFGRSPLSNCLSDASSDSLMFVPPVGCSLLTKSSPRFLPVASAAIRPRSIRCSSPAKLMMLNLSPSRSVRTPNNRALRALSILPSSAIEPDVSRTKTMSLLTSSFSETLSFGESISRK